MINFNAKEQKSVETGFTPVPAGDYTVIIDRAEMVTTQAGGNGIKLTYQIVDGEYANRLVFDFLNYECPSSQLAEDIGRSDLKDLCYATGEVELTNLSQLLHKPFKMGIKVVKDTYKGDGSMKNERSKVHLVDSAAMSKQSPQPVNTSDPIPGKPVDDIAGAYEDLPF